MAYGTFIERIDILAMLRNGITKTDVNCKICSRYGFESLANIFKRLPVYEPQRKAFLQYLMNGEIIGI